MVNQGKLCLSIGRTKEEGSSNAHGSNEEVEEAAKASVWSCFIVVKDIVLQKLYYILKMYTMLD